MDQTIELLVPAPFCIQTPDGVWHVTPHMESVPIPGRYRYAAGVMGRTACDETPVRVHAVSVERQPECDTCCKLVYTIQALST